MGDIAAGKQKSGATANASGAGGVMAIRLVLSIIEQLVKQDSVGVTELSKSLGTTKARVFRHLRTLLDQGYAVQDADSERYSAGPRMTALLRVAALTPDDSIIRLARPVMARLRDQFGHAVNLSLAIGETVRIGETIQGNSIVEVVMNTNMPMPLHTTAAGKLLLADMMARGRAMPAPPYEKFTENSITDPESLRTELARVAIQGWAAAPEEVILGVNALSAPIRDHRGELVAMISLVSSIQYITRQPDREMIEALKQAAEEVTEALSL